MALKVTTWNVNGIRAREASVLEWVAREQPDVLCLQEIKASPNAVPPTLAALEGYWSYWHGHKGYSGVGLALRKATFPAAPAFSHPPFDLENRIVVARVADWLFTSIYVPNGRKDLEGKVRFLEALTAYAGDSTARGLRTLICGDLNVARTEIDVHPSLRRKDEIGQTAPERALLETLIAQGLDDLGRRFDPDNDRLFSWWAPWRNNRERNIGWRLDYVLASAELAKHATACASHREFGSSDHAPVTAHFDVAPVFAVEPEPAPKVEPVPETPVKAAEPEPPPAKGQLTLFDLT